VPGSHNFRKTLWVTLSKIEPKSLELTAPILYGLIKEELDYIFWSLVKHTLPGDFNWSTLEEVEAQLKGAELRISR
jgi:hypothetical protein